MKIKPLKQKRPILGTKVLDEKYSVPTYLAKLRAFVKFLLQHPTFNDSLIVFFPYTPKGKAVCEDRAVSMFMISKTLPKGSPVVDMEVSNTFQNRNLTSNSNFETRIRISISHSRLYIGQ